MMAVANSSFWMAQIKRLTTCTACGHSTAAHFNKFGHCQKCDACEGFEGTYDELSVGIYMEKARKALEEEDGD